MTPGHCLLSHGLHSRPDANKVSALARTAERLGWTSQRLDYRDLDESGQPEDVERRIQRLVDAAQNVRGPLVLAGSSLGAYTSAMASLRVECVGLYLMAPPVELPHDLPRIDAARVPTWTIHAWRDEVIPAQQVIAWCGERLDRLTLVDDTHRLEGHVDFVAEEFGRFLEALA